MDLASASSLLRLLADPTRVRLLALLEREELTVAELAAILQLAQPRVSTHLAKLKEAGMVRDRRAGVSSYYHAYTGSAPARSALLSTLRNNVDDALLTADAARLPAVLAERADAKGWADIVAGDMERHYSPGRTWETMARAMLQLVSTGDVLDIASGDGATAELLAPHARSILCIDAAQQVTLAARERLQPCANVEVRQGDMHDLQLGERGFDLALMLHALTYAHQPGAAISEAAASLRSGGQLLAVTLARHGHETAVAPFGHCNLGFDAEELAGMARDAGLEVAQSAIIARERKPPNFEVLCLLARKPN